MMALDPDSEGYNFAKLEFNGDLISTNMRNISFELMTSNKTEPQIENGDAAALSNENMQIHQTTDSISMVGVASLPDTFY